MSEKSERSKDDLIKAQNELIGILFEIIKRLQANNDLDSEYFNLSLRKTENKKIDEKRLDKIMQEKNENSKIVGRLLDKLKL